MTVKEIKKEWYVYRHIRLDKNEVFYIGIGKKKNFERAYWKYNRNKHWTNIFNKTKIKVEILASNLSLDTANELEMFLVSEYGRRDLGTGNLVNLTDGGDGVVNNILTKEQKEKIKLTIKKGKEHPFYGKHHSKKIKEKIANTLKGRYKGEKNPFYGKKHSKESLEKMSKIHKGKKISEEQLKVMIKKGHFHGRAKKVKQLDLEGNLIKIWDCVVYAEIFYNNEKARNIGATCRNKQKTAYGYKWEYLN